MRHLFLINPTAGRGDAIDRLLAQIETVFAGEAVQVVRTTHASHAEALARQAGQSGQQTRLYACGGDGTLNEVVNGAAGYDNLAVTLIPLGTGNDFLRVFDGGPQAFLRLDRLKDGPQAVFDVMDCNGRLGLGVVCAGVDARIGADVHNYNAIRAVSNTGAYIASLVVNLLFRDIARPMRVEVNGQVWDRDTTILCVCNGRSYGGGFTPVTDNRPDDGVLEVLLVPRISRLTFLRLVGRYAKGRYAELAPLLAFHRTQAVTFSSPAPLTVVVDGEVMEDTRFTLRLSEKKLRFFYPIGCGYLPGGDKD